MSQLVFFVNLTPLSQLNPQITRKTVVENQNHN